MIDNPLAYLVVAIMLLLLACLAPVILAVAAYAVPIALGVLVALWLFNALF